MLLVCCQTIIYYQRLPSITREFVVECYDYVKGSGDGEGLDPAYRRKVGREFVVALKDRLLLSGKSAKVEAKGGGAKTLKVEIEGKGGVMRAGVLTKDSGGRFVPDEGGGGGDPDEDDEGEEERLIAMLENADDEVDDFDEGDVGGGIESGVADDGGDDDGDETDDETDDVTDEEEEEEERLMAMLDNAENEGDDFDDGESDEGEDQGGFPEGDASSDEDKMLQAMLDNQGCGSEEDEDDDFDDDCEEGSRGESSIDEVDDLPGIGNKPKRRAAPKGKKKYEDDSSSDEDDEEGGGFPHGDASSDEEKILQAMLDNKAGDGESDDDFDDYLSEADSFWML